MKIGKRGNAAIIVAVAVVLVVLILFWRFGLTSYVFLRTSEGELPICGQDYTQGMISYWQAENNATDSYNINHGTLTNGATFAEGKVGQAFSLDGIDDYINVNDADNLEGMSELTMMAWVKLDGYGEGQATIMGKSYTIYEMMIGSANYKFGAYINGAAPGAIDAEIPLGNWTHLTVTYDGSYVEYYINGQLNTSIEHASGSIGGNDQPFMIGARSDGSAGFFFNGSIDEVAIFNRNLNETEIQQIYQNGLDNESYCEPPPPLECGYVNSDLTLRYNLNSSGTCFIINASNIVLDCAGYSINYSASSASYAINNTGGFDNVTIKNCIIKKTNSGIQLAHAIYYESASEGKIINNSLILSGNYSEGIILKSSSNNNIISNNNISAPGTGNVGIRIWTGGLNNTITGNNIISNIGIFVYENSDFNNLNNNNITASQNGIRFSRSSNNTANSNNITTTGSSGHAVYLALNSSHNNLISNEIMASGSDAYAIYLVSNSINNNISYNNLYSAQSYYLYNDQSENATAERNWWETISCPTIDARIYDYGDNAAKGAADYEPLLDAAWPAGSPMNCDFQSPTWSNNKTNAISDVTKKGDIVYFNVTLSDNHRGGWQTFIFDSGLPVEWVTNTQAEFDQGSYVNTSSSGNGVVLLVGTNKTGTYTSAVKDAGSSTAWHNISWEKPQLTSYLDNIGDSFVDEGAAPFNQGDWNTLWVHNHGSNQDKRTLIKFNLTSIPDNATISSGFLYLYVYERNDLNSLIASHLITNDSWIETGFPEGVSWNNMPNFGTNISDNQIATEAGTWTSWNVTRFVDSEYGGDKILSIGLKTNETGSESINFFYSRDEVNASIRPYLEINYIVEGQNLTFQVRSCSQANCSDGSWIGPDNTSSSFFTDNSFNNLGLTNLSDARYFQYKAYFTGADGVSPELWNVTIGYAHGFVEDSAEQWPYAQQELQETRTIDVECQPVRWKWWFDDASGNANETDTWEITAFCGPAITIISPSQGTTLPSGTTSATINISTDENAECRYSTSSTFNFADGTAFTDTGGLSHTFAKSTANGQTYNLYYKCNDTAGNINPTATQHSFSVASPAAAAPGGGGGGVAVITPVPAAPPAPVVKVTEINLETFTEWTAGEQTSVIIEENTQINFQIKTETAIENHSATLTDINQAAGTVTLVISSEPITVVLHVGETKEVDVNGDGTADILIIFKGFVDGKADIVFKSIAPVPVAKPEEIAEEKPLPKLGPEEIIRMVIFFATIIVYIAAVIAIINAIRIRKEKIKLKESKEKVRIKRASKKSGKKKK